MSKYKIIDAILYALICSQYGITMSQQNIFKYKWYITLSIYNGERNPAYLLNDDEIDRVQKMIADERNQSIEVAADDKNKHKGQSLEYQDYKDVHMRYSGLLISCENQNDDVIHLYRISGRYIRIWNDDGDSSNLYKMKNNNLEQYLIKRGIEKGKFEKKWENIIKNISDKNDRL
jgi:hypothetical protein